MTDVKPPTDATNPPAPHQQAATDAAHKMSSDTNAKPAESSGWDLGSMVSSALHKAEDIASSVASTAAACLPSIHIFDSAPAAKPAEKAPAAPAPAAKPAEKPTSAAPHPGTDKPATATPRAAAPTETKLPLDSKAHAMPTAQVTAGSTMGGLDAFDPTKKFVDLKYMNETFSVEDTLKQAGCDTGNSCPISTTDPMAKLNLGTGFNWNITKAKSISQNDENISDLSWMFGDEQLKSVFDSFQAKTGTKVDFKVDSQANKPGADQATPPEAKPGTVIKTADGFKLVDASGKPTVVKTGDLAIRYNASGTTSEYNAKTGESVLRNPDGSMQLKRWKDGSVEYPVGTKGDRLVVAPDGKSVRLLSNGIETTYALDHGKFTKKGFRVLTTMDDDDVPDGGKLLARVASVFDGDYQVVPYKNGIAIVNKNHGFIQVNRDGSGVVSLDDHSWLIKTKDDHYEIHYNDGRQTQLISDDQFKKMTSDPKVGKALIDAFDQMAAFRISGVLKGKNGESITTGTAGVLITSANGVTDTQDANNNVKIVEPDSPVTTTLSAGGRNLVLSDTATGAQITSLTATPDGAIRDNKTNTTVKAGVVTTADGTTYGPQGIKFADGTNFQSNGNITDNRGTTYNPAGEVVAFERPTSSGATGTSGSAEQTAAKAQVSQAESMAASVLGRVAGGHATAGDIAALLSSFEKLGSLVSTLSDCPDTSLMAAACIAQGEVAGSLEIARDTVNRRAETNNQMVAANPNAVPQATAQV